MADRHGSVARISLLHHEHRHGFAHDVATSQHDTFLSLGLNLITLQQFQNSVRSSRHITRQADGHPTYVDGMETVHILAVIDGLDDLLLGNVLRERQLDDESVYIVILIQLTHLGQQFLFRHIRLVTDERRLETANLASLHLIGHIGLASSIVSDQNRRQMRTLASFRYNLSHFGRYFLLHLFGNSLSIYQCHIF